RLPTMEIPFPEAAGAGKPQESPQPLDTNPGPNAAKPPAVPSSAVKPVKAPPKPAGPPIWKHAIWKLRIDPIIFTAVAGAFLAVLVAVIIVMSAKKVSI